MPVAYFGCTRRPASPPNNPPILPLCHLTGVPHPSISPVVGFDFSAFSLLPFFPPVFAFLLRVFTYGSFSMGMTCLHLFLWLSPSVHRSPSASVLLCDLLSFSSPLRSFSLVISSWQRGFPLFFLSFFPTLLSVPLLSLFSHD